MNLKEFVTVPSPESIDSLVESGFTTTLNSLAETTSSQWVPNTGTLTSVCSSNIPGGVTSVTGGLGTTGTLTFPNATPTIAGPFTAGGVVSGGGGGTYVWPQTYPPNPPNLKVGDFDVSTELDDDGKETLILSLGERKNCNYKMQLLPGIILYSNHGRPGFFQRFIFKLLFGIKWESTLAEKFINAL